MRPHLESIRPLTRELEVAIHCDSLVSELLKEQRFRFAQHAECGMNLQGAVLGNAYLVYPPQAIRICFRSAPGRTLNSCSKSGPLPEILTSMPGQTSR